MPIPQMYYLDAATLSSATAVYLDELLTVCAPDGFYSDGVITRELVGCSLLPEQICISCTVNCPLSYTTNINVPSLFLFNVETYNPPSDEGAIIIKITTGSSTPIGVRAVFDNQNYNTLSSPFDGYHQSLSPFNYTFVGDSANDCTPPISGESYLLQNYKYDGINLVSTGVTQSITVNPSDVSFSAGNPNYFIMVVPKPFTGYGNLMLYIAANFCGSFTTSYPIEISCPTLLPSIGGYAPLNNSGPVRTNSFDACISVIGDGAVMFFASLTGSSTIAVYDYVYYNEYGITQIDPVYNPLGPVVDGFYRICLPGDCNNWIQVENGVVVDIGTCI